MALILVIEDNPQHSRLVGKLLTRQEHVVISAKNAHDGLTLVASERPDLVLLDIDLPDLDGKTVANRLRRIPHMRYVPVVACSANVSPVAQRLALAYGCDGFIPKPIDIRSFPKQIDTYLSAKEALKKQNSGDPIGA
jgi:CheY-like chemotaxis protein